MNKNTKVAIVVNSVMYSRISELGLLLDKCPESLCGFALELAEYSKVAADILVINQCQYMPENAIDKKMVHETAVNLAEAQINSLRENGELFDEDKWSSFVTSQLA